jgi:inorganic pyrophosphatase
VLAVPIDRLCSLYRDVVNTRDLPELVTSQISHFFEHYKDLEPGKWVKIVRWGDAAEAQKMIVDGIARAKAAK